MGMFRYLAFRNMKRLHKETSNGKTSIFIRLQDRNLLVMVLVEVFVYVIHGYFPINVVTREGIGSIPFRK
jgi:hypothetical protein